MADSWATIGEVGQGSWAVDLSVPLDDSQLPRIKLATCKKVVMLEVFLHLSKV